MHEINGFLLINKPAGVSSYDCIRRLQKILGIKKRIGHAGTLDPFATGLLIVAIGRQATKQIQKIMELDKEYVATGELGILTDTLDGTGLEIKRCPIPTMEQFNFKEISKLFCPSYLQTPPIFSALRHEGKRLYSMARKGKRSIEEMEEIALKKQRMIHIHSLELLDLNLPYFTIRACVSHGTYIRSLVNDIAQALGSCATTIALERSAIGPFTISQALDLGTIKEKSDLISFLIPVENFLQKLNSNH